MEDWHLNTPESREGNLIRYAFYLAAYLAAFGVAKLATAKANVKLWNVILFVLISAMAGLFFVYRFNREQRFFKKRNSLSLFGDLGYTIGMTILVTALRILLMYYQEYGKIAKYSLQTAYVKHESTPLFWMMIVCFGIVLPILQQFVATGFLFNYAFRQDSRAVALVGIIASGVIFSVLNFQMSLPLLLIDLVFGAIFAWAYLYTQSIWMPLYLATLNGLLMIVML